MANKIGGYGFEIPDANRVYDDDRRAGNTDPYKNAGRGQYGAPTYQRNVQNGDGRRQNAGNVGQNGGNTRQNAASVRRDGRGQAPARDAGGHTGGAYQNRSREVPGQRNARVVSTESAPRIQNVGSAGLTDRQMRLYEKAYYEKYGRSPYVGGDRNSTGRGVSAGTPNYQNNKSSASYGRPAGDSREGAQNGRINSVGNNTPRAPARGAQSGGNIQRGYKNGNAAPVYRGENYGTYAQGSRGGAYAGGAHTDRRQAYIYEEELKRREAERARLAAAAEARRRAEAEARRAEAMRARALAEMQRQAEIHERDREGRLHYENEKRRLAKMERAKVVAARRAAAERLEKKKRRRHMWRIIRFHLKVFFITFIMMGVLTGVYAYTNYFKDNSDASRSVRYSYFGGDAVRVGKGVAYRGGSLSVNFTEIAKGLGLYTVGNSGEMKYVFPDTDSVSGVRYIKFIPGSPVAEVNGTPLTLSSPAYYTGSVLWVSVDIMDCFSRGIEYVSKAGKVEINKIIVRDEEDNAVRDENGSIVYEDIVLRYAPSWALSADGFEDLLGDVGHVSKGKGSEVDFISDLSEYEEYMNPEDSTEFLMLVNKTNTIGENYVPTDLTDLVDTRSDREARQMRLYAAKALEAMFIEMRAAGYTDVSVTSGYRSYAEQRSLFNTYITNEMAERGCSEEEARQIVLTYSAAPGTSEHQTGLCVDMHNLPAATTDFADEEVYDWLSENAWKFGFILRFPEDKTQTTGYSFEPWHYRYVGRYAAEKIHNNGQCLEEYLAG